MTEHEHYRAREPDAMPVELAAALDGVEYACLTIGTDAGTAILIKAPRIEIESVRGQVPVHLGHELYDHPSAPVIRLALRLYDQATAPLAMETFINVADPNQRADYAALADQDAIPLLFLDETLQPRLTKQISHHGREAVPEVLAVAEQLLDRIPHERFDFERAKQAVMEGTRL